MITPETLNEWHDHPVTRMYKQALEERVVQESSLLSINHDQTIEAIGAEALARLNFAAGLAEAADLREVLDAEVIDE